MKGREDPSRCLPSCSPKELQGWPNWSFLPTFTHTKAFVIYTGAYQEFSVAYQPVYGSLDFIQSRVFFAVKKPSLPHHPKSTICHIKNILAPWRLLKKKTNKQVFLEEIFLFAVFPLPFYHYNPYRKRNLLFLSSLLVRMRAATLRVWGCTPLASHQCTQSAAAGSLGNLQEVRGTRHRG